MNYKILSKAFVNSINCRVESASPLIPADKPHSLSSPSPFSLFKEKEAVRLLSNVFLRIANPLRTTFEKSPWLNGGAPSFKLISTTALSTLGCGINSVLGASAIFLQLYRASTATVSAP